MTREEELLEQLKEKSERLEAYAEALHDVLKVQVARAENRLLLQEEYRGKVTLVTGEKVTVVYKNINGRNPVEIVQTYKTEQFLPGTIPSPGTELIAFVWITAKSEDV